MPRRRPFADLPLLPPEAPANPAPAPAYVSPRPATPHPRPHRLAPSSPGSGTLTGHVPLTLTLTLERAVLLTLQRLSHSPGRRKAQPAHLATGERGELEALFHLRARGYKVIERRWRTPECRGDLDLVAWDGATLCFVEVKTRSARGFYPAALAVDAGKRQMLRRMARAYLATLPRPVRADLALRFDVVSVYPAVAGLTAAGENAFEVSPDAFPFAQDDE